MKQPRALIPIFFTEMWERFGYYAIQGLLVLYLVYQLKYSAEYAFVTLGEFLSWVYVAPLLGGLISDHILGYRYSILSGAILLVFGYLLLAFSGVHLLHMSLAIIIVGNGLLKPNSAAYLGEFYYHDDPRRYPGFTFLFIGINFGGFLSIIFTSIAIKYLGFQTAYAFAGIGMLIAVAVFVYGFRYFENRGLPIDRQRIQHPLVKALSNRLTLFIILLITIQVFHFLLHSVRISEITLSLVTLLVVISLFYIQSYYTRTTRNRLIAVLILTGASVIYWSMQLQIFFSLMLFTERHVERTFFNYTIPAPFFIILEPLLILLLGPILARFWERLAYRRRELDPASKFAIGLLLTGLAMLVIALSTYLTPDNSLINPIWLVIFYCLITLAGLLISPTGLAMITELAPQKLTGFMMGIWYMVIGLGGLLAGTLARHALNLENPLTSAPLASHYNQTFTIYALLALAVSGLLFLFIPQLKRMMQM